MGSLPTRQGSTGASFCRRLRCAAHKVLQGASKVDHCSVGTHERAERHTFGSMTTGFERAAEVIDFATTWIENGLSR